MTKYSDEFQLRLVMEVESGQSITVVARAHGIPKKNLQRWVSIYEHGGIEQLLLKKQHYSQEFKISAIEYRWQHHLSYRQAAAELEIPNEGTLYQWEKRYLEMGSAGLQATKKGRPPKMPKKSEKLKRNLTREQELEAENAQLRMENAYLKKLNALVQERIARESGKKRLPSTN
ncbi:transposase IS3/IS911 family protein [Desulforamulus ruminis DSM 2154]|uniref:Transposase IS3/IS911 family protein n=1 Tax=Desulforamulus ruminis (strain ATCC 23193 / DSM 2154 / NCIMB 8452 / DL) TaxID=696281 RepID=F6DLX5_DESRL|nr:transposase IS3/IS911 family protein [Desulforamulus ruminis DSM 2154]AEG60542.1 transposase IS3/IS911 family protein [Desulforamulus ruminis DSM 2154]AEG60936.1 transposase IS3/IS911 family protein [Desulforamulus ruminis DSM 2154]